MCILLFLLAPCGLLRLLSVRRLTCLFSGRSDEGFILRGNVALNVYIAQRLDSSAIICSAAPKGVRTFPTWAIASGW